MELMQNTIGACLRLVKAILGIGGLACIVAVQTRTLLAAFWIGIGGWGLHAAAKSATPAVISASSNLLCFLALMTRIMTTRPRSRQMAKQRTAAKRQMAKLALSLILGICLLGAPQSSRCSLQCPEPKGKRRPSKGRARRIRRAEARWRKICGRPAANQESEWERPKVDTAAPPRRGSMHFDQRGGVSTSYLVDAPRGHWPYVSREEHARRSLEQDPSHSDDNGDGPASSAPKPKRLHARRVIRGRNWAALALMTIALTCNLISHPRESADGQFLPSPGRYVDNEHPGAAEGQRKPPSFTMVTGSSADGQFLPSPAGNAVGTPTGAAEDQRKSPYWTAGGQFLPSPGGHVDGVPTGAAEGQLKPPTNWNPYTGECVGQAKKPGPPKTREQEEEAPESMVQEDWLDDVDLEQAPGLAESDDEGEFDEPPDANEDSEGEPDTWQPTMLPWFEAAFSDSQRAVWQSAEKLAGLKAGTSATGIRQHKKEAKSQVAVSFIEGFGEAAKYAGLMAGFAFKTGHKGTGYYQDALPTAPEASSNDHEPPRDGTDDDAGGPTSRADRKRDENGKRLRKRTRKKMANTATDTPFVCQEGDIDQDRWWVQYGWWAIDSVNPNSWTTAKAKVLNLSSADAIGMQETKVEGEEKISDAKRHARDLGWNSTFTGAKSTPAQRASGGCAVCARKGTGVSDKGSVEIDDKVRHRVCHAWVNGVVKGGLHVFSVYAKDLIGPVGENLKLLEELVAATRAVSGPWIITADWNMTPEALSATGWPRMIGGCIVAPSLPTCNEEVYDFFVVSEGLRHAVKGIQRIKGAGLQPHFPVRIFISGNARRLAVRKLVKAQRVHGTLPHGPANKPADFSGVHDAARKGDVTQAMTRWYKLARAEWSSLTGRNLEHRRHRFAWASAVGRVADPNAGTSFAARLWRYAATTAKEAQQALGNKEREGYAQRRRVLEGHLNDVVTRAQGDLKSMDHGQKEAVQKWSESLTAALTAESIPWCASLSKVAGKRAEKMEAETMRRKQAAWRTMLGNGSSMEGGTGVPTRTAYRWVKGICGWTSSAVGPDVQSEAAFKEEPDDPDAYEDDWSTSDNSSGS